MGRDWADFPNMALMSRAARVRDESAQNGDRRGVPVGRRRGPADPGVEVLVAFLDQALERVQVRVDPPLGHGVSEGAEDEVHLLHPPPPAAHAEPFHPVVVGHAGLSHSQAAPRTPELSPCLFLRISVAIESEKT